MQRSPLSRLLAIVALGLVLPAASAQEWPSRPLSLVVPFPPGGSADGIARIVGRELSVSLGKPVVVENKPGAGGATGLITVARSAPDGHTLGLGATGAIAINPHLPDAPPLSPDRQLQPIAKLADIPLVLVAGAAAGLPTLKAVLEKASAGEIPIGNAGQYTAHHLAAELLAAMTRTRLTSIPYKGSAPATVDVLGGQTPVAMVDLTSAAPHLKTGALLALAVTTTARTRLAPEIPTMIEAGVPGYSATAWMGLFAPKGLQTSQLDRLNRELQSILAKPEVQAQILALSAAPAYLDGDQFATFIAAESAKWSQVIGNLPKPAR